MEFITQDVQLVDESSTYDSNFKEFRSGQMVMKNGIITLYNSDNEPSIQIDSENEKIQVGDDIVLDGNTQEILIYDGAGNVSIYMKGGA